MASTIATVDIKRIHKNYLFLKENYPDYGGKILYFLATYLHLDPRIDLDIALKQREYLVLIIRRWTNISNLSKF